jgi:bifunctional DNA-binding transcriptional regulator/antitoxin component of YhaV-PrlF toxin-antitoxin module
MTAATSAATTTLLRPDGDLAVPEELRRVLGLKGGWQCSIEVVNGVLVVRPLGAIPDEDLWAYEPETHAQLLEAAKQPLDSGIRLSPQDLKDLWTGRVDVDELIARSKSLPKTTSTCRVN